MSVDPAKAGVEFEDFEKDGLQEMVPNTQTVCEIIPNRPLKCVGRIFPMLGSSPYDFSLRKRESLL